MGQKVSPTGLRIGVNKNQSSVWYADKKSYSKELLQDVKAREFIQKKLGSAGVAEVKISKTTNSTQVEIYVARPGVVIGRAGKGIEDLKKNLDSLLKTKVELKVLEVKNAATNAAIVASNVAEQISRRVAPKVAISRELENIKKAKGVLGAKIAVTGRIKGTEIARTEKAQYGSIPLQTLRADIDYYLIHTSVPNAGMHGVKVWVYKGEKRNRD